MRIATLILVYSTLILIFSSVVTSSPPMQEDTIPFWNTEWSYRQEIQLPISTNDSHAKYQPIDMQIAFDNPCWTKNENETSIRVCCWDGMRWHELDSQIYDLTETQTNRIEKCNLVFLVPEIADGKEKYYIYYDDTEKTIPNYTDHVAIEDAYYFSTPVSDISAEAKYYGIKEDGCCIYGVGQEGELLDRSFSNIIVKQKKNMEKFDLLNADQIVSFAFSYYYGNNEDDESSSDQSFVHKDVFVDGNLMVEFGIISESNKKDIRTTVIYKYYYSPLDEKRISVRVKHELSEDVIVKGKENIDGRFGVMFSFKSRNPAIKKMNFGEIFPYLWFYGENDKIKEYQMDIDPESKNREWILSFEDDADLGKEAWIAYGDDDTGKTNSVIFSSSTGIVTSGIDERDGIQLKIAEKEYFNFLGTEIDYASINFGRNSYEKGQSHDLKIPEDLVVEFDAELFTTDDGGYEAVQKEAKIYQELVAHRQPPEDSSFEQEQKKHRLAIVTHFGGTRFSYPWLAARTDRRFPVMWIELCQNGSIVASGVANRSFFHKGRAHILFPKVVEGDYLIKVYWKIDDSTKFFRGAKTVTLDEDSKAHVFCTWEREIQLCFSDQNSQAIDGVHTVLLNEDDVIYDENTTNKNGEVILKAPYNPRYPYILKAYYRDILVYDGEIKNILRDVVVDFDIDLYDLTVEVKDTLNLPPGVQISPTLLCCELDSTLQITSEEIEPGIFFFEDVPSGSYKLQVTYARFVDEKYLKVPEDGSLISMGFSAIFDVTVDLFDLQGNRLIYEEVYFEIERAGKQVYDSDEPSFSLPPGSYTIRAYADGEFVGSKDVELTNDKNVKLVTTVQSITPTLIVGSALVFIGILVVLTLMKRLDVASFLKLLAIVFIVIALVQPWWCFFGLSSSPIAERNTEIFVVPQVMIESTSYQGETMFDVAEMPELFVDLLGKIVFVAYAACIMLGVSFLSKKLGKKNYSLFLDVIGIILLIVIISMFYVATSKICEASIGEVQGEDMIGVSLGSETVSMQSSWGFTTGFYLVIVSAVLAMMPLFFEVKNIVYRLRKRNSY